VVGLQQLQEVISPAVAVVEEMTALQSTVTVAQVAAVAVVTQHLVGLLELQTQEAVVVELLGPELLHLAVPEDLDLSYLNLQLLQGHPQLL
jgi:hypothetical protein